VAPRDQSLRLGEYLQHLAGDAWRSDSFASWPPDVFALVAGVLDRTGCYTFVIDDWPPCPPANARRWLSTLRRTAGDWRRALLSGSPTPTRVLEAWQRLVANENTQLRKVCDDAKLQVALLELLALADDASENFGLPSPRDAVEEEAARLLAASRREAASLCRAVHPTRLQVLPKQHTPQTGISVRSLSHHLAMIRPRGVAPRWFRATSEIAVDTEGSQLNVLCVPWPLEIPGHSFRPATPPSGRLPLMKPVFGFFEYEPPPGEDAADLVSELIDAVDGQGWGPVHMVVLPELALSRKDYEELHRQLGSRDVVLIAGVWAEGERGRPGQNVVRCDFVGGKGDEIAMEQPKHHRWLIDYGQIDRYGLTLDKSLRWWEHCTVRERSLSFITVGPRCTFCVLICEDLARQEPAADVVRAVGPNLVIALLLDGPQLPGRWPARYATVLADDPGSTVLTLTSIGMVNRSVGQKGLTPSRAIGLYKDPEHTDPEQILLEPGHRGVLLSFRLEAHEEWTADGRSDGGVSGRLLLAKPPRSLP